MEKDYKKMYEDALERAMNLAMTNNISALAAGEIFPELNESEDEKIKKEIIKLVHFFYGSSLACKHLISEDSMIAWLEKQGEHKCDCKHVGCHVNDMKRWCHKKQSEIPYEKCNIKCSEYLKDDEQKPTDKVEPKFKVGDIIRHKKQGFTCKIIAVDNEYRLSDCNGTHLPIEWQDAYELVEQKSSWSEEDEVMLRTAKKVIFDSDDCSEGTTYKLIDWLKSLKDRVQPQPKQEWSEEDEACFTTIIKMLEQNPYNSKLVVDNMVDWFKSLKPNHWKPSEEQLEALNALNNTAEISCPGQANLLINLYNDLKKL